MLLTDVKIRNAKPGKQVVRLKDGEGLYLLVRLNGTKYWQLRYRHLGREKTISLGKYPQVSLGEARKKKVSALSELDEGINPSARKKKDRLLAVYRDRNTFLAVAEEWHERNCAIWSEGHQKRVWQRLNNHVLSHLGNRPISDIEPIELLEVIRRIESAGKTHMAKRVLQICGAIFKFAIVTGRVRHNIADGLISAIRPHREIHSPSLAEEEIPKLLGALVALKTHPQNSIAFRVLLLTALRTGEMRFGRWEHIHWKAKEWRIPAEAMKMRRPHVVPLSSQVIELLTELHHSTGNGEWMFPNLQQRKHPVMSEGTILAMINRMGYKGRLVGHGMRAMFSTILNERGFNRDAIERQLAHADENRVRAAYNRADYLGERRDLIQWWADFLDEKESNFRAAEDDIQLAKEELSRKYQQQARVIPFKASNRS